MSEKLVIGEKIVLKSEILGEDREILIRTPKGFENSTEKYPVLFLLDAEYFFQQTNSAIEFLSECGYINTQIIPQMVVVGIVNVDRNRDYTPTYAPEQLETLKFPTSGKAEKFLKFMEKELFPFVEENYRIQPFRILAGWSLGGLLAVHTYLEHPDLFSAYLAISPSLWWDGDLYVDKIKKFLTHRKLSNKPMVTTIGSLEGGDIGRSVRDGFIRLMVEENDVELAFQFTEIPDENHSLVPYKAFFEGLKLLYSDWIPSDKVISSGINGIEGFYQKLSKKYQYQIRIPESVYIRYSNFISRQGKGDEALEITKKYVQEYPQSSFAHFYLGARHERLGEFNLAIDNFKIAIEMEKKMLLPESEKLIAYRLNLQNVEEKRGQV